MTFRTREVFLVLTAAMLAACTAGKLSGGDAAGGDAASPAAAQSPATTPTEAAAATTAEAAETLTPTPSPVSTARSFGAATPTKTPKSGGTVAMAAATPAPAKTPKAAGTKTGTKTGTTTTAANNGTKTGGETEPVATKAPKATPTKVAKIDEMPVLDEPSTPVTSNPGVTVVGPSLDFPASKEANALRKISQVKDADGTLVRIEFTSKVPKHRVFRLKNPNRLLVDLEETDAPTDALSVVGGVPLVKSIKAKNGSAPGDPPMARLEIGLDMAGDAIPKTTESAEGTALSIRIHEPAPGK